MGKRDKKDTNAGTKRPRAEEKGGGESEERRGNAPARAKSTDSKRSRKDGGGFVSKWDREEPSERVKEPKRDGVDEKFVDGGSSLAGHSIPVSESELKRLKRIWNDAREGGCPKERRERLLDEIWSSMRGRALKMVFKHDFSRVVQTLLKRGSPRVRDEVAEELLSGDMVSGSHPFVALSKAKYGHQLAVKMLRYGSEETKKRCALAVEGKVTRMLTHAYGAVVLEAGWAHGWDAKSRWRVIQEAYGPAFARVKDESSDRTLGALLERLESHAARSASTSAGKSGIEKGERKEVLRSLRYVTERMIEKRLLGLTIAHRVIADLLDHCSEDQGATLVPLVRDAVAAMLGSHDGGRAVSHIIGLASAKDRKSIAKALCTHLDDVSRHDQGHLAVVHMLDATDDTRLLTKQFVRPLLEKPHAAADLACDRFGRKIFLHILSPHNRMYFSETDLRRMRPRSVPDDKGVPQPTSKKDQHKRQEELLEGAKDALVDMALVATSKLARNRYGAQVLCEIAATLRPPQLLQAMAQLPGNEDQEIEHDPTTEETPRKWFGGEDEEEEEEEDEHPKKDAEEDDRNDTDDSDVQSSDEEDEEEDKSSKTKPAAAAAAAAEPEEEKLAIFEDPSAHKCFMLLIKKESAKPEEPSFSKFLLERFEREPDLLQHAMSSNRGSFTVNALCNHPQFAKPAKKIVAKALKASKDMPPSKGLEVLQKALDSKK